MDSIFNAPHSLVILLASVALFFLAVEIGFRVGCRGANDPKKQESAHTGVVTGSILGLTSFLLAFTFGFASTNYLDRRGIVLEEANALGTAFLRADLLPEEAGNEFRAELLAYTRGRVEAVRTTTRADDFYSYLRVVDEIHGEMWSIVAETAKSQPSPTHALVVSSVNDVIDLHAERVAFGTRHTIPMPIWIALFAVSAIALATTAYRFGVTFSTRPELMPAMVIAFACVVTLIADLNTPASGFLQTDQKPMEDVLAVMER